MGKRDRNQGRERDVGEGDVREEGKRDKQEVQGDEILAGLRGKSEQEAKDEEKEEMPQKMNVK